MSYLQFHLVFIVPPLVVLLLLVRGARGVFGTRALWTLPVLAVIAFVYTTPWDNYLVYRGVWGYGSDRVIATIGYVPVEEYMFFLLQPLLTGGWCYFVLMRRKEAAGALAAATIQRDTRGARTAGALVLLVIALAGAWMLRMDSMLYAGLILAWAAPVLAGQWFVVGGSVARAPRTFAWLVVPPTLYLWVADRIAIGLGIWHIAPEYTTGLHLVGLPIEEALFFLVTNLLVVLGTLLFLAPAATRSAVRPVVHA